METLKEIKIERVDDIPVLIGIMRQLEMSSVINTHIPEHGNHQGLGYGELMTVWLSHILTECNHKLVYVREWVDKRQQTLESLIGASIRDTDFTDDRLGDLLSKLSDDEIWSKIEKSISEQQIRVYDLTDDTVRVDSTTIKTYSKDEMSELLEFGHSKDHRDDLKQFKMMLGSLDTLGLPIASTIVGGNRADDPLYIPVIQRIEDVLEHNGILFVGDCKMSALETRAYIVSKNNHYLTPLALVGKTPQELENYIEQALSQEEVLEKVYSEDGSELLALGLEFVRLVSETVQQEVIKWEERVLLIRSISLLERAKRGLMARLEKATKELYELTPPRGKGVGQFSSLDELHEAIEQILSIHNVKGLLNIKIVHETEKQTHFVGRGRPSKKRPKKTTTRSRYVVKSVKERKTKIKELEQHLGWRAYVTDASNSDLSLSKAVMVYRDQWSIERDFKRLKNRPLSIAPIYLKREDYIIGMARLLTIALQILILIETVVREKLKAQKEQLKGWYPSQPNRATQRPTAEFLLRAFENITLTKFYSRNKSFSHVTPLSNLQIKILNLLGLPLSLYSTQFLNSKYS